MDACNKLRIEIQRKEELNFRLKEQQGHLESHDQQASVLKQRLSRFNVCFGV